MRMTSFWGDDSWKQAAYAEQTNLFGGVDSVKYGGNEQVVQAYRERLQKVAGFKYVPEPMPMRNSKGAIVYYLFFASQMRRGRRSLRTSSGSTGRRERLMASGSSIEWTEATWNPVTGCDKISPGCKHCYAERMAKRLKAMGQANYKNGFQLTLQARGFQHEDRTDLSQAHGGGQSLETVAVLRKLPRLPEIFGHQFDLRRGPS
jgi:hypothetical protein